MKKLATIPIILLLFAVPSITQAQSGDGGLMLGPRMGYYKAQDADDGSFLFGLQLRSHLTEYFGVELAATYRTNSEFNIAGNTLKTGLVPITASALIYAPISPYFKPYGVAGLGAYYKFYDTEGWATDEFKDEFTFGYHLGVGVEIPLNEGMAIDVDYRYIFLDQEGSDPDLSGNTITAGLMFYL